MDDITKDKKELKRMSVLEYLENIDKLNLNINLREYCTPANILLAYIVGA